MSIASKKPPLTVINGPSSSERAREIIRLEAAALESVAQLLGQEFDECVKLILSSPSDTRIIVSGMGKAGYVGMKFSATLASLGLPSFFLHPADAVHGDLGRCTKHDIAIILSNSGETPEIVRLLPILKRIGVRVISITAIKNSTLGSHSDLTLQLGKLSEADPLGLAPTTTTTAMLALSDALAITLSVERGATPQEFALYHPGGSLGRSLMLVSHIMRVGDQNCIVHLKNSTSEVIHAISSTRRRPGAAAIVDDSGELVGVFTDGNLRLCLESGSGFLSEPIERVMSKKPKTVRADQLAEEAARVMQEHEIDQVIVIDEDRKPIGLVDVQDLLAHGIK